MENNNLKLDYSRSKIVAVNSFLGIISLMLAILGKIPAPGVPFLGIEFIDAPVFISAMIFGVTQGISILVCVGFVKSLFFSVAGFSGFIMRLTSMALVFMLAGGNKFSKKKMMLRIFLGIIIFILIKMPISYFFWTRLHGMPPEMIKPIMLTIVAPVNILKAFLNVFVALKFRPKIEKIMAR